MFHQLTPHFVSSPFRPPAPHDVFWKCTGVTIKKMIQQRLYTLRRQSLLELIRQSDYQFVGAVLLLLFNVRANGGKKTMEAVYCLGGRRVIGMMLMLEWDLSFSFCFFFSFGLLTFWVLRSCCFVLFWVSPFIGFTLLRVFVFSGFCFPVLLWDFF